MDMNKPVAWIGKNELQFGFTDTRVTNEKESWDDIPLYTYPVKELTDEEITNTWKECGESDIAKDMQVNSFIKYFAKAILRKAQEK